MGGSKPKKKAEGENTRGGAPEGVRVSLLRGFVLSDAACASPAMRTAAPARMPITMAAPEGGSWVSLKRWIVNVAMMVAMSRSLDMTLQLNEELTAETAELWIYGQL